MLIPVIIVFLALGPLRTKALPWLYQGGDTYGYGSGAGRFDDGDDEDWIWRVRNMLSHEGKDRGGSNRINEIGSEDPLAEDRRFDDEDDDITIGGRRDDDEDGDMTIGGRRDDDEDDDITIGGRRDDDEEMNQYFQELNEYFQELNSYFKELNEYYLEIQEQFRKYMKQSYELMWEVSALKGAKTTEKEVNIEGKNGSLSVDTISSVETASNKTKRSNPDAEPYQ